jgi:MFS family permease
MLSPAALSILTTTFQEGRERNRALGIWGAVAGSGGAVGVLLGGVLTSAFSWPWIFYVNVPVGAAVIAISPWLLRESRADLPNRYFDFAGAATITTGLMLLVYAMTRATQHGWGTPTTIGLLTASAVLIASFFLIESRTKAPLLPLRIFRLRTLAGSNLSALIATSAVFSQFFLLTLYMQQVLHYSALKTGVAYIGLTVTTIALSALAQGLVTRLGVRSVLPFGLALSTVALVLFAQLPVDGHYFWDLFPGFIISGLGLAFVFIPMSIGALTAVRPADAGIASGLINTSQQIGGAIGVAAATTIATTFTARYVDSHAGISAFSGAALMHGFQIAFYFLAATAAVGAALAALLIESQPARAESEPEVGEPRVAVSSQHTPVCRTRRVLAGHLEATN